MDRCSGSNRGHRTQTEGGSRRRTMCPPFPKIPSFSERVEIVRRSCIGINYSLEFRPGAPETQLADALQTVGRTKLKPKRHRTVKQMTNRNSFKEMDNILRAYKRIYKMIYYHNFLWHENCTNYFSIDRPRQHI